MKTNYYLAALKPDVPGQEYPIRINKKGFLGVQYTYQLRSQRFYASRLSYPGAVFFKLVSPLFPFKEENGTVIKARQIDRLIIRTTV